MILRVEHRRRFTTIENATVEDERLSFKALGLLVFLLSKPDRWEANYRHLSTTHSDGPAAVRTALQELEQHGYIERRRERDTESGQFRWVQVIRERPDDAKIDSHESISHARESHAREIDAEVKTEVATTEEVDHCVIDAHDSSIDDLCALLADAIERQRGGSRPKITKRWRDDMRKLLTRGPLHVDKPEPQTPAHVRATILAVFDRLAEPDAKRGFCWADQVRSPGALRDHWVQMREAYKRATVKSTGKGATTIERVARRMANDERPQLGLVRGGE